MVIETTDRPHRERIAVCDGCGRRVPLARAGLVEDGGVLCPSCARLDLEIDSEPPIRR